MSYSLTRTQVLELLPCYVCGDIPPELTAYIDAEVQNDPDLRQRVEALRKSREQCMEQLAATAPPLDFEQNVPLPVAPTPASHEPTASPIGLVAGMLAAALMLLVLGSAASTPPAGMSVGALHAMVTTDDDALIRAPSHAAMVDALQAAGVSPQLAMTHDLSAMGFEMVGVRILGADTGTAPGIAIVYEREGQRFVCQIQLAPPTYGAPSATDVAAGVVLRAYQTEAGAIVSWRDGGRWCVFGGPVSTERLLAMVKMRMTSG